MGDEAADRFGTLSNKIKDNANAARLAHAEVVGQTPAIREARIVAMKADEARDFGVSDRIMSTVTPQVWNLLNRPVVKGVIDDARDLAISDGKTFGTPPGTPMRWSGQDIHYIKKAIDGLAHKKLADGSPGLDPGKLRSAKNIQKEFLAWVDGPGANKAYGVALGNSARHHNAIDRMKFGQDVKKILEKRLEGEYTAALRAETFAAFLDTPLKKSNGYLKEVHPSKLLTPGEMKAFQRIKDDLARERRTDDLARTGRKAGGQLNTAATDWAIPPALHRSGTANAVTRMITGHADETIAKRVGPKMLTQEGSAELLKDARTRRAAIYGAERNRRNTVRAVTKAPALYNALQPQGEERRRNAMIQ